MPHAPHPHLRNRACTDVYGRRSTPELFDQTLNGYRQKVLERLERSSVRTPVVEHAEDTGQLNLPSIDLSKKSLDRSRVQMTDDLCEVVLGGERLVFDERRLLMRIGIWIGPPAERKSRDTLTDF